MEQLKRPDSGGPPVPAQIQPTPPQAYMGSTTDPRLTEGAEHDTRMTPSPRSQEPMGVVEDLQGRVARIERALKLDNVPKEVEETQQTRTGAAELLVDLRNSHSSAMNPKRSIVHQVRKYRSIHHHSNHEIEESAA